MMYEKEILQALQTATTAAVAASSITTMPVKYLGRTFPIPNDQKYVEIVHIPNNPSDRYWGEEKIYRGIFRLVLHWKIDDAGFYLPLTYAASVASYFTKGKMFSNGGVTVKIIDNPNLTSAIETGIDTIFPVSISYGSFVS